MDHWNHFLNKSTVITPDYPDTVDMHHCFDKLANQIRYRSTKILEDKYGNTMDFHNRNNECEFDELFILGGLDHFIYSNLILVLKYCKYITIDVKTHCNKVDDLKDLDIDWKDRHLASLDVKAMFPSLDWSFTINVVKNKIIKHQSDLGWSDNRVNAIIDGCWILSEND
eukprot:498421_1